MTDEGNFDDEFTGIFDALNPNDFAGVTSAPAVRECFADFVDRNIRSIRVAFLAVDGNQLNPIAILQTSDTEWMYAPEDNESLGEYLNRLREEASRLNAKRLFISRTTKVGVLAVEQSVDAGDRDTARELLADNKLSDGLLFFAAQREGDVLAKEHGIMVAHGNRLGDVQHGDDEQTVSLFARILDNSLP